MRQQAQMEEEQSDDDDDIEEDDEELEDDYYTDENKSDLEDSRVNQLKNIQEIKTMKEKESQSNLQQQKQAPATNYQALRKQGNNDPAIRDKQLIEAGSYHSNSSVILPHLKERGNSNDRLSVNNQSGRSQSLLKPSIGHSQSQKSLRYQDDQNDLLSSQDDFVEKGLIKAKQEKMISLKNAYSMQSRILKLKMQEEQLLKKIDNERRKAEELQQVRMSYDQKMQQLKIASFEREQKKNEYYELNQNKKSMSKLFINEKINEICRSKKQIHDDVVKEKQQIEKEKQKFQESVNYQKHVNALMIKEQLQKSKQRMLEMKIEKDQKRKESYIERVNNEKKKKKQTDKQVKQLSKIEQDLQERVKSTVDLYKSIVPIRSINNSVIQDSHRYQDLKLTL
ncbi:UNKNOWN [Stylonychia lemnae]|uniref:Uncharacterized protein n=1 Tax=Stylonychia lemnae TaxID=5949 RepID=A0A078AG15_STYLE|nr:UNKNOWN [Stylonychia lemnae]|eukprot:CDW80387.1 UNKNOWN [Stylonychia lemnae]